MVTKVNKPAAPDAAKATKAAATQATHIADAIRDSAQQIWQAGLGAFAKAQEGRGKVFDSLVQEGLSMQRKTQAAAEERINAATSKVTDMANDISAKATGQWDKLESIFEERVAKALKRLGLPTADELAEMREQIAALSVKSGRTASKAAAPVASKAKATAKKAVKAAAPAKKAVAKKLVAVKKAVAKKPVAKKAAE